MAAPLDREAGLVARTEDREREGFADPSRGAVTWATLFSGDITPTGAMSAGLAELAPHGGHLAPHRHAQPEIYFISEGAGVVTVSGVARAVSAGDAVFIPGGAEHGIRNDGDGVLRFFYVFPVDRFSEVVYRFS